MFNRIGWGHPGITMALAILFCYIHGASRESQHGRGFCEQRIAHLFSLRTSQVIVNL
jgi:hypothetical protein